MSQARWQSYSIPDPKISKKVVHVPSVLSKNTGKCIGLIVGTVFFLTAAVLVFCVFILSGFGPVLACVFIAALLIVSIGVGSKS